MVPDGSRRCHLVMSLKVHSCTTGPGDYLDWLVREIKPAADYMEDPERR